MDIKNIPRGILTATVHITYINMDMKKSTKKKHIEKIVCCLLTIVAISISPLSSEPKNHPTLYLPTMKIVKSDRIDVLYFPRIALNKFDINEP